MKFSESLQTSSFQENLYSYFCVTISLQGSNMKYFAGNPFSSSSVSKKNFGFMWQVIFKLK